MPSFLNERPEGLPSARLGQKLTLVSTLPLPPLSTMLASSSTLERLRSSPRSEAPKRHTQPSSPLSNSHTVGAFISPSMDSLLHDSHSRSARPRRKGLSWNLPWTTNKNSSSSPPGLIHPVPEAEKAEGGQAAPLRMPWHHGWRVAFFGSCWFRVVTRFRS